MTRIVSWFSCGNNSAVASKLAIEQFSHDEVVLARCVVDNEHPDNERFHQDCERWFGREIVRLRSDDFDNCWDVWEFKRFISGIHGAPCTIEMKKKVRWRFEREWFPDFQVFGFDINERARAQRFCEQNPDVRMLNVLIQNKLTKQDCADIVAGAGIELPMMYKLGFSNNNCIGCGKATSIVYWARTRHYFPEQFARMSMLSRSLGARLTRLKGKRIFLDEIPSDIDWRRKDRNDTECGLLCGSEVLA